MDLLKTVNGPKEESVCKDLIGNWWNMSMHLLFILYWTLSRRNNSNENNEINIDIIIIIYLLKCTIVLRVDFLKWPEIGLHLQLDYLASEVIIRSNTVHVRSYARSLLPLSAPTRNPYCPTRSFCTNHVII